MRSHQNELQLDVARARMRNLERAMTLILLLDSIEVEIEELNMLYDDDGAVELELLTEYADLSSNTEEAIADLITLLKDAAGNDPANAAIIAHTTFRSSGYLRGIKATIR